jgi:hypothetical protein
MTSLVRKTWIAKIGVAKIGFALIAGLIVATFTGAPAAQATGLGLATPAGLFPARAELVQYYYPSPYYAPRHYPPPAYYPPPPPAPSRDLNRAYDPDRDGPLGYPTGQAPVPYGTTCYAGAYVCQLPAPGPVGSGCACSGIGAPSYGSIR